MNASPRCRVVGAYAMQPQASSERPAFIERVISLPGVTGLEIPYGAPDFNADRPWLRDLLPAGSANVFTLISATLGTLETNPQWGPASADPDGRQEYLDFLEQVRQEVVAWREAERPVVAVQLQTAPRGTQTPPPSADALRQTLAVAAQWDWCGAQLVIEHCESYQAGRILESPSPAGEPGRSGSASGPARIPEKGFLPLDAELAVLTALAGTPTPLGLTINWGRSAIDTLSADGPAEQIRAARSAGVLQGLMLSGATATESPYGAAWLDRHAAGYATDRAIGEPASLLTPEAIRLSLELAGDLLYDGIKIGIREPLSDDRRIALLSHILDDMG